MYFRVVPRRMLDGVGWPPLDQGVGFVNGRSVGRSLYATSSQSIQIVEVAICT